MYDTSKFQTPDFKLAAYLYAKGIILEDIISSDVDRKRKYFVFSSNPVELISSYQAGNAEISVMAFTNAQDTLRTMLREANNA